MMSDHLERRAARIERKTRRDLYGERDHRVLVARMRAVYGVLEGHGESKAAKVLREVFGDE